MVHWVCCEHGNESYGSLKGGNFFAGWERIGVSWGTSLQWKLEMWNQAQLFTTWIASLVKQLVNRQKNKRLHTVNVRGVLLCIHSSIGNRHTCYCHQRA
jgi:hypothetical protein